MNYHIIILSIFLIFFGCKENIQDLPDPCYLEPDSGPCEAAIPRYYYDPNDEECKEFIWGGCDGIVPFITLEECRESCE